MTTSKHTSKKTPSAPRSGARKPTALVTRTQPRKLAAVVLAAGQGKRMLSPRAKVVHEIAGLPLVSHVLAAIEPLGCAPAVVVVGHDADSVCAAIAGKAATAVQREQLGTGHAVLQARKALAGFDGDVLVLCGDVPLLRTETIRELVRLHRRVGAKATVLSAVVDDPSGYGRIVRGETDGDIRIVEDADASPDQLELDEINTGTYCFDAGFLFQRLSRLERNNAQGEYYLTDLVEAAAADNSAACVTLEDGEEGHGVNTRADLARIESILQERLITRAMEGGVTFLDPATAILSTRTQIGPETVIGPAVRLEGDVRIGRGCVLEGSTHLRDTVVEDGALLRWGVVADRAHIGSGARVGPFAHLRPEAELGEDVHIGNFVEVKKATVGARSKANHLAYIGDATVGRDVNIGAGTITCNYDGVDKHRTMIGDRVQIGSDTQLVAPVSVGADAYIAAGSTISKDVEAGSLAFNEKPQRGRSGWVEAFRARKAAAKPSLAKSATKPSLAKSAGKSSLAKPAAKPSLAKPATGTARAARKR
ncbi:MAG TPA: bifunctional UDP-N-acetylglucosamine diphosphorylase/glucosamine-1-phosphate N-acetyltransferase GlmU [Candidatus Limnocylindrales bacterium]|nr:bifunctional UDP-N-acetylglucosamine diphosphorylase/glucosamine-1-phosphate N-acetyltransferase GlmU [Candidatus Limnocylindrales bacterium]